MIGIVAVTRCTSSSLRSKENPKRSNFFCERRNFSLRYLRNLAKVATQNSRRICILYCVCLRYLRNLAQKDLKSKATKKQHANLKMVTKTCTQQRLVKPILSCDYKDLNS
jgi:hypothetical protein